MEQKDYKTEIIIALLKGESHVREIAKNLSINHMMISRKIKELSDENIADYKEKGKNKVYFLKNTIEAKTHIFKAEQYKLIRILGKYPNLREIFEKIQKDKRIKMSLLFGSYAKGIAKPNSDIDVYIETSNKEIKKDTENINSSLSIKIGKYNKSNLLAKEIEKNHIIIKGVEEYYEKHRFFEQT
ncbi:nucleotidyltransferase domain protein [archaeon BMS3Abin17]|nr:nucleotidyltransferase domain protein [archaeon BMS3Abin17]